MYVGRHLVIGARTRRDIFGWRAFRRRWRASRDRRIDWPGLVAGSHARLGHAGLGRSGDPVTLRFNRSDRLTGMRGNDTRAFEIRSVDSGRNGRVSMVVVERQRRIPRRGVHVFNLLRRGGRVRIAGGGELRCCRPCGETAVPAIEADIRNVVHHDRFVVDVDDCYAAEVVDGAVVKESTVAPIAPLIANAVIAEAVVDAAIEPDLRSPIAGVEEVDTVIPAPIAGSPE